MKRAAAADAHTKEKRAETEEAPEIAAAAGVAPPVWVAAAVNPVILAVVMLVMFKEADWELITSTIFAVSLLARPAVPPRATAASTAVLAAATCAVETLVVTSVFRTSLVVWEARRRL